MPMKLGQLVVTAAVNARIAEDRQFARMITKSLNRYQRCDWGDICEADKKMNDLAVRSGDDRILASYHFPDDEKIWIITEWDHSVTTILFPEEY